MNLNTNNDLKLSTSNDYNYGVRGKAEIINNIFKQKSDSISMIEELMKQLEELCRHQNILSTKYSHSLPKSIQITVIQLANLYNTYKTPLTDSHLVGILKLLLIAKCNKYKPEEIEQKIITMFKTNNFQQNIDIYNELKIESNIIRNIYDSLKKGDNFFKDILIEWKSKKNDQLIFKNSYFTDSYRRLNLSNTPFDNLELISKIENDPKNSFDEMLTYLKKPDNDLNVLKCKDRIITTYCNTISQIYKTTKCVEIPNLTALIHQIFDNPNISIEAKTCLLFIYYAQFQHKIKSSDTVISTGYLTLNLLTPLHAKLVGFMKLIGIKESLELLKDNLSGYGVTEAIDFSIFKDDCRSYIENTIKELKLNIVNFCPEYKFASTNEIQIKILPDGYYYTSDNIWLQIIKGEVNPRFKLKDFNNPPNWNNIKSITSGMISQYFDGDQLLDTKKINNKTKKAVIKNFLYDNNDPESINNKIFEKQQEFLAINILENLKSDDILVLEQSDLKNNLGNIFDIFTEMKNNLQITSTNPTDLSKIVKMIDKVHKSRIQKELNSLKNKSKINNIAIENIEKQDKSQKNKCILSYTEALDLDTNTINKLNIEYKTLMNFIPAFSHLFEPIHDIFMLIKSSMSKETFIKYCINKLSSINEYHKVLAEIVEFAKISYNTNGFNEQVNKTMDKIDEKINKFADNIFTPIVNEMDNQQDYYKLTPFSGYYYNLDHSRVLETMRVYGIKFSEETKLFKTPEIIKEIGIVCQKYHEFISGHNNNIINLFNTNNDEGQTSALVNLYTLAFEPSYKEKKESIILENNNLNNPRKRLNTMLGGFF